MVEIPTADWSWINEAAERFEQAWKKGPRPRIEDFLAKVPEPGRPPLLSELLRVERELRARAGEGPTADEYRRRFPEHDDVVASVFASVPPKSGARTLPATEGAATTASRDPVSKLPPELANHPDYEIIRELGHGGMGVVFLAHNRIMGLDEVLKVIGPDIIESPGAFERFLREIRAVARLQHPNIVTAHSGFRCGESLVFAMEYVEGLDLARMVMAKGPMPVKHASYFVHQAALGLQHAHEDGMVHRDIKPGNLMLTHKRGKAVIKVLDFGLAKAEREQMVLDPVPSGANRDLSAAGGLTRPEEMLGTPDFIAPEQIVDSRRADIRADIYSLGCTLYYLLSGRAPFQAASIRETLQAHRSMDARLLNLVRPEVPAELAALVAKMMAKEPDRRFQTPSDVAIALAPFFKNPTAAAASPNAGVDQDLVPDAVRVAPVSASETGHGMWSSLIDFRETEDDEDASEAEPARVRPQWLWPAVAAGLLFCGLIAAGGVGIVKSVLVKKDGVELAGAEVSIGTEESERLVASKPRKAPGPVAEPSPGSEALRPNPDTSAPAQLSREIAGEMPPPVAEPLPGNKAPPPKSDTPTPAQVFQKITAIPTPDLVLQARLIFNSGRVLFETGGRNRALWRGDLSNPQKPRKLKASVPGWVHLAISSNGGFAVLATENSL